MFNLNRLEQNEGNVCGRLLVLVIEAENLQQASTGKNACALYNTPSLCKLLMFLFIYSTSHGFFYLFLCFLGFLPMFLFLVA